MAGPGKWSKLTPGARGALFQATDVAEATGSKELRSEHLLWGILSVQDPLVAQVLEAHGVTTAELKAEVDERLPPRGDHVADDLPMTPSARAAIQAAFAEARALRHYDAGPAHVLLGLCESRDAGARVLLAMHGLRPDTVRRRLIALIAPLEKPPVHAPQPDEA